MDSLMIELCSGANYNSTTLESSFLVPSRSSDLCTHFTCTFEEVYIYVTVVDLEGEQGALFLGRMSSTQKLKAL